MPPKQKTPAPIDRPLSRAYLREFTGWSTAYPPGISDPTSLRIMENVQIQRDGSVRVRPGLRAGVVPTGSPTFNAFVGTHETFFLNNGKKAYLFAVREIDGTIGFRVWGDTGAGYSLHGLTDTGIGFVIPQGEPAIHFTSACSYVKYLQIDNKIFALSNSGEMMRYFTVGESKTAKRLYPINRPAWDVSDKLTVVSPTQAWIASGTPIAVRYSSLDNQSFETNTEWWNIGEFGPEWTMTRLDFVTGIAHPGGGSSAGVLRTRPWITNWHTSPMYEALPGNGIGLWGLGSGTSGPASLSEVAGRLRVTYTNLVDYPPYVPYGQRHFINGPVFPVPRQQPWHSVPPLYWAAFDFSSSGISLTDWAQVSCLVRFYNADGTVQIGGDQHMNFYSYSTVSAGVRLRYYIGTIPDGASIIRIFPNLAGHAPWGNIPIAPGGYWAITNVRVVDDNGYGAGPLVPGVDADAYWSGGVNVSSSNFHPPEQVLIRGRDNDVGAGRSYAGSFYLRAATTGRDFMARIAWRDSGGYVISTTDGAVGADVNTSWTRFEVVGVAPPGAVNAFLDVFSVDDIPRGEQHYVDHAMFERDAVAVGTYFDATFPDTSTEIYDWATGGGYYGDSRLTEYSGPTTMPTPPTYTANTLISSDATKNVYNFGFFYTFSNEVGESAASQVTVVKCQRGWSQWKWETANASSEPSGTHTDDPNLCADQLVAYMPQSVFQDAMDQGAISWSLYALTWSDQDPAPVTAVRLTSRTLPVGAAHGSYGYLRMTPQQADANAEIAALPSEVNRFNYSNPSRGGNGLVAADRMVMVYDPQEAAVVRWSSNEMGKYSDFTANKGGGFKTLSSGNVNVPAAAVLWQNPQSADTITILCLGVDGRSTGYYMAPAQVASQSEAVNIMGFEETTATPGTTSPFGVEVVNNALYHPIDEQLMKSTAMNYNITHSSMTDAIQDVWRGLTDMEHIVSSLHDNRIYYLVNNPRGAPREPGCFGNEVWVLDASAKAGSWSRWLVQGHSLKRFEQNGQVVMSLVRPDGIYYFDESYAMDDRPGDGEILSSPIPWQIETNTQGANRAHDAWCHLQQANIILGNFQGTMRYGVRGLNVHGKMVDVSKLERDANPPSLDSTAWDIEGFLAIRHDIKEWFFYAGSVEEDGETLPSSGQINLVQYRYTPVSVNVGYEYGSPETFEYGRAGNPDAERTTVNGVPKPMIDVGRP
jgi:hypothetical protein